MSTASTKVVPLLAGGGSQDVVLNQLSYTVLSCKINGRPKPQIAWFIDGSQVNSSDERIRVLRPGVSIFRIPVTNTTSTAGVCYSCQAVGDSSVEGSVNIIGARKKVTY